MSMVSTNRRLRPPVLCFTAALVMACGIACVTSGAQNAAAPPQSGTITITLAGQSMIRSDIRATSPAEVPVIQGLLKGDVVFTNLEGTVAEKGQSVEGGGRGFLAPPEALDALQAFGFNLLALADNHAFDLKVPGIQNTIHEADARKIAHAGTGNNVSEAVAPG
jgi:hypothetical protein